LKNLKESAIPRVRFIEPATWIIVSASRTPFKN